MTNSRPHLNALILAAGFGTRLKEIGRKTPKGLFFNSQDLSILDLMLQTLKKQPEVKQIALVSNNRFFSQYQSHIQKNYSDQSITLLNDGVDDSENRRGSLGDLVFALDQLEWWNKNVLVLPSDRTPEKIITNLVDEFSYNPNFFITCVSKEPIENIRNKSGCAILDEKRQVIEFEEKPANPKSNYRGLPFYIFPQKSLALLKEYQKTGHNMDSPGNIVPWLLENKFPVKASITKHSSFDIGDLQELKQFQEDYKL
ncbi:MAG: Nucleotidyl transferase [Microgenomates bacterium 39_7]|nr:MAG: Nucleotidyl transferase [Microgenomates bacterium 39_7]